MNQSCDSKMKGVMRTLCFGSAMLLFVSSVAQGVVARQLIDSHSYEYDAVSNIVERTSGGVTTEFGYDLVGQLISETRNGYSASYTYDANGNRLTRTVNSVTEEYEYDGADKLLEVKINSQAVKAFSYDAAGRTTSITTSTGTTTMSWQYEDRLVGITYPSTATNSFSYNGFGARVSKTDSSGTSTYARNGVSVVAPVLSDGSLTYTPGISSRDGTNSTWSHGDIKNSLRQTAANESTSATKHYDAFGNETTSTGTWHGPFQYGGPFGYQTDPDSSLELLGHRYYDGQTGRFLTKDPLRAEPNHYVYARSSPAQLTDPSGELTFIPVLGIAGALFFLTTRPAHAPAGPVTPEDERKAWEMATSAGIKMALLWLALVDGAAIVIGIGRLFAAASGAAPVIHMGKQGKHILGHSNYIPGRSVLTHPNPQQLVNRYAGKGTPVNQVAKGQPGYKERVDFGEEIGLWVDEATGQSLPTTKGIIIYSKDGVHIVPAQPGPPIRR